LHDPPVLILDEPTDGLDPNQKRLVRDLIREMAREKAIIISTHILEEVDAVCDRAVVIAKGALQADGTPEQLRARSPHHNAIVVTVPVSMSALMETAAVEIAGVAAVEKIADVGEAVRLRLVSAARDNLTATVSDWLRSKNVAFDELLVEQGSLDDVFHTITEGDGDA
jgi:ABC-2 type transport system ATP-binding protein